jgi:Tol biopolymer transport system component
MRRPSGNVLLLVPLCAAICTACASTGGEARSGGIDYFGQAPPGDVATIFAPGRISTGRDELNAVFSPDGQVFLTSVKLPNRQRHSILALTCRAGGWSEPRVAPFSGVHSDADPCFSPDGETIYYISTRPLPGEAEGSDWNVWSVDCSSEPWGEPRALGAPVNTDGMEIHPSMAAAGAMYFSSDRPGGHGATDVYRSAWNGSAFEDPVNLGASVNSAGSEGDLFVAPDESYLIFTSGRPGGFGGGDLYVSFRLEDGGWTRALNLGPTVNSEATEYCPAVSPDGLYLFFTSYRRAVDPELERELTLDAIARIYATPGNGLGDLYWVEAAPLLEQLRAQVE